MARRKATSNGAKKSNPVVGFSVPPELDAKIEAYAKANGFTKSTAMRHMVIVFFSNPVNFSNIDSEVIKQ